MSVSSSLSESIPSRAQLEQALRSAVRQVFESGNTEDLTVKRVRVGVERDLNLPEGFFKGPEWKDQSKAIIEEEALKHNDAASPSKTPPKKAKAPISQIQSPAIERNKAYKKRKLSEGHNSNVEDEARAPKRRSKTKVVIGDDEGSVSMTQKLSGPTEGKSKKTSKSVKDKPVVNGDLSDDGSDLSDVLSASPVQDTLGDSDLSEVLDEAPKPKRKKNSTDKKAKAEPRNIGKPNKSQDSDPQAEEIKSLQRWLAKCGIRKFWAKELKTYETPREKIKHLKGMLSDVGMTGRYSKEKAASIRETRELAADLEAVQEGAKLWGKDGDDHKAERRRPTRTTLTNIDFIEYDSED